MVTRRGFIVSSSAVLAACGSSAPSQKDAIEESHLKAPPLIDRRSLINYERAYEIMDQEGVDGLIAFDPLNVFYLGNHLGYKSKFGARYPGFAVFSRDENKDVSLVLSVVDQWHISNKDREFPNIIPYTGPVNWQDFVGNPDKWDQAPIAGGGIKWTTDQSQLSEIEKQWLAADAAQTDKYAATSGWGLVEALRQAGLSKSRVAVDDLRIATLLKSHGIEDVTCVDGENIFRKIRMVKSATEIEFMRAAAVVNQTAAHNTVSQLMPGATVEDIEHIFRIETAKLGAEMDVLSVGTYGGLRTGEIVKGEPIMIDAVSKINGYCGDYGRTFVYGSPSNRVEQRVGQLDAARQAVFEMLKPGVRYSEIQAVAKKAMSGAGLPSDVIARASPHSVGMTHTDEPVRDHLPFEVKDDLVLVEGMVITVDLPCYELGWGSTHLEDTTLITKDGAEILGTADAPIIVGS